eukprot:CAMPEP_0196731596 /NCGR_PEP_ID=MMETSP1091-20130531/11255_1 /TAXON_ID=302021 /ORGANISM="Rhodomonas sp., Strain CCMP768" /LENGTH=141 /DNA_ID=CAMNT_0042074741 /DNA_START=20 /DNA_END=445 /DNA_ORIENTATION=+
MNLRDLLPQSIDSEYNQAVQLHKAGDVAHAEEHFRTVLKRKPNHVQTLLGLGSLLLEKGNTTEAKACMEKATGFIMNPPTLPGESLVGLAKAHQKASRRSLLDDQFLSSRKPEGTFSRTSSSSCEKSHHKLSHGKAEDTIG